MVVAEQTQRAQQHPEALAPSGAAREHEARRPRRPLPVGMEHAEVHARRDDTIGAGEGERGHVPRGDRRGDGRVQ
jgi:hypothetical protein